jgi:uncharacterized membrane protein YeaQ/YmgE (transglycosylase-associated protein family)
MNIVIFLLVGLLAGWIASSLVEGQGLGTLGDIFVGVIGAMIGGFVFDVFGVTAYGFWGALVMSVIGAIILLLVVGLFTKSHSSNRSLGKF